MNGRELLLLRHGKSDWGQNLDDFNRPLKERGIRGAQRIAVWLQQQDLLPDFIISSPAVRAIETAKTVCNTMGMDAKKISCEQLAYGASLANLLKVLKASPGQAARVMLVGHNPGLEELLVYLAKDKIPTPSDGNLLPTATLARLVLPDDWSKLGKGCGTLKSITRPKELPKRFPFPDHRGKEMRDRPAYYYTQSSVIPYRINKGKLEILLVRSHGRKHWVIPKGICEPGLTLQESAAKEALEEAGISGEVGSESVGSYRYEKWGGSCQVHVYPMAVTGILSEEEWQENYRGREWMKPKQAAEKLKPKELRDMIMALQNQPASP
jgi:phosphohistidine phosphatase